MSRYVPENNTPVYTKDNVKKICEEVLGVEGVRSAGLPRSCDNAGIHFFMYQIENEKTKLIRRALLDLHVNTGSFKFEKAGDENENK